MKSTDVTSDTYAEYNKDFNEKDPKFEIGDRIITSKYKNTALWTYIISDLNSEPILEVFMRKNCKKLVKKNTE